MIVYKGYKISGSYHCLIGCLENYLTYYNIPIAGVDLFFLSKGYEIKYELKENNRFVLEVPHDYMSVLDRFGIHYKSIVLSQTGDSLKKYIIDLIEAESAVILKTDSERINYNTVFARNKNTVHFFNVIGYDYNTDRFCISDSFIPAYIPFYKQLWIETSDLLHMWEGRKELLILEVQKYVFGEKPNTRQAVISQLKYYLEGSTDGSKFYGKTAIKKFLNDVEKLLMQNLSLEIITEMNFQLRVNGFLMGREYLCVFLQENRHNRLADCVLQLLEKWKKISFSLVKYVMTKNYERLRWIFKEANELCASEENLFAEILQLI